MVDWNNKKVTILGLGRSGIAAASYLARRGACVLLSESGQLNESKRHHVDELKALGVEVEHGEHSARAIESAELVITSPGIPPHADVIKKARACNLEVISDIELAYRETKTPIIAVTGTNGKSTTTALISFLLSQSGKKAPACGNIGVPIFDCLNEQNDFLVVEVSSYQMFYTEKFAAKIAIWLNLTPDHLDWHGGLAEYIKAKEKLFLNQQVDDFAVLNMDDPITAKVATKAKIVATSVKSQLCDYANAAFLSDAKLYSRRNGKLSEILAADELQIIGAHNIENALAASGAVAAVGLEDEEIRSHLKEFTALEHRLEYVDTIGGIAFYNDSKATNVDSTIKALQSFPKEKVVLIAGGRDKGTDLGDFVHHVKKYVSAVILIGEAKERFEKALREGDFGRIYPVADLQEAVNLGEKLKAGPVLLSPACASFDMFNDFEDRGRVFKRIVQARLKEVAGAPARQR